LVHPLSDWWRLRAIGRARLETGGAAKACGNLLSGKS
jgi:hypothetical protein